MDTETSIPYILVFPTSLASHDTKNEKNEIYDVRNLAKSNVASRVVNIFPQFHSVYVLRSNTGKYILRKRPSPIFEHEFHRFPTTKKNNFQPCITYSYEVFVFSSRFFDLHHTVTIHNRWYITTVYVRVKARYFSWSRLHVGYKTTHVVKVIKRRVSFDTHTYVRCSRLIGFALKNTL